MDRLEIPGAHVVGNSMGGRVAIEMGLTEPDRIGALGLLCPAVAWIRRGLHPIVRLLRPEFGLLPHTFRRSVVASQFWSMFHDRDLIDPAVADLVVDEFLRIYHTAGARYALLASARNIYLEAPFGRHGFYRRLADLRPPALFVWGSHDRLVPPAFSPHVRKWLPQAEQVTIAGCGHVPQVERPEETNELLLNFFGRAQLARRNRQRGPPSGRRGRLTPDRWPKRTRPSPAVATVTSRPRRSTTPAPSRRSRRRCWTGRGASSRASSSAAFRAPTSTSATPTTSGSSFRCSGCSPASGSGARCAGSATSPTRGRCCSSATTRAGT